MKAIKLTKGEAHDLSLVLSAIVSENSPKLDFKEIIHLQKAAIDIDSANSSFLSTYRKIADERKALLDALSKKTKGYRKERLDAIKDSSNPEDVKEYKQNVEAYVNLLVDDANIEIDNVISPQFVALYEGEGKEDLVVEFDKDRLEVIVNNFEKYAKEKYTNKTKMIEVYEKLAVGLS